MGQETVTPREISLELRRLMTQNLPPDLPRNADECRSDTKRKSEVAHPRQFFPVVTGLAVPTMLVPVRMNLDALDPRYDLARQHRKNHGSGSVLAVGQGEASWMGELSSKGRRNVNAQKKRMPCDNPNIAVD